jgi:general secretion pathway protein D
VLRHGARDAINFDIHPGIEGTITLNAIDQTLKQILTRISKQVDLRWEAEGGTISVMPDSPYLKSYRVNYVNMARDVSETVGIATQVISGTITNTSGGGGSSRPPREAATTTRRCASPPRTLRRRSSATGTCCARSTSSAGGRSETFGPAGAERRGDHGQRVQGAAAAAANAPGKRLGMSERQRLRSARPPRSS